MGDLSSPTRDEPVPPTLEGEVLTTGLPGKYQNYCFFDTYLLTFAPFSSPFIIPFTFLFAYRNLSPSNPRSICEAS